MKAEDLIPPIAECKTVQDIERFLISLKYNIPLEKLQIRDHIAYRTPITVINFGEPTIEALQKRELYLDEIEPLIKTFITGLQSFKSLPLDKCKEQAQHFYFIYSSMFDDTHSAIKQIEDEFQEFLKKYGKN